MKLDRHKLWNPISEAAKANSTPSSPKFYDWAGIIWDEKSFPIVPNSSHSNFRKPDDGDGFRAGPVEWEAFAICLYFAKSRRLSHLTAIELGASAAPWMLTLIRHIPAETKISTLAIEAGRVRNLTEDFWRENGLSFKTKRSLNGFMFDGSNFESRFIRAFVGNKNGVSWFPRIDISRDNGATGNTSLKNLDRRGVRRVDLVRNLDLPSKLSHYERVNFLHMDIQGSEVEIMEDARFLATARKIEVLLIGTHTKYADELALSLAQNTHLKLLSYELMKPGGPNGEWPVDGEFLFVNDEIYGLLIESNLLLG